MSIIRKVTIIFLGIVFFMSCAHNSSETRETSDRQPTKNWEFTKRSVSYDRN